MMAAGGRRARAWSSRSGEALDEAGSSGGTKAGAFMIPVISGRQTVQLTVNAFRVLREMFNLKPAEEEEVVMDARIATGSAYEL